MQRRSGTLRNSLVVGLFLLALAGIWQLVASLGLLPSYSLPSPAAVGTRMAELAADGSLAAGARASLIRMLLGFGISATLGLLIGLAMGMSRIVSCCLRSLFLGLQTLPSAAWVPIALMLFGLKDSAIYFVIIASSMTAIAIATGDGIANVPPHYLRVAQNLGLRRLATMIRVTLPAALPGTTTGIKLGWTLGWHGVVSAELIRSTIGLGFLLHMGRELNDAAQVVGVMLVTILLGLLLDQLLFARLERRIRHRWGLDATS